MHDDELQSLPIFTQQSRAAEDPPAAARPKNFNKLLQDAGTTPSRRAVREQERDRPAAEPITTTAEQLSLHGQDVNWALVRQLTSIVSTALSEEQTARASRGENFTEATRHTIARQAAVDALDQHISRETRAAGERAQLSSAAHAAHVRAVLNTMFGLGRLQPLVDDERVENIDIYGYDNVWVQLTDGSWEQKANIANTDDEVIDMIRMLATNRGDEARPFDRANPRLHLDITSRDTLHGSARLVGQLPPILPRPGIVIRLHRMIDTSLEDMVGRGSINPTAAAFLRAAVAAKRSIVVAGEPGAGKTTFLRALASAIDPQEPIVTIENERELYLDRMPDRHRIVKAMQGFPGFTDPTSPTGVRGEIPLLALFTDSLRFNVQRIIVGELRGGEVRAMFQAMQAGAGSFSTVHADSATETIDRLVTLFLDNADVNEAYAQRRIMQDVDLILHLGRIRTTDGTLRRVVTEISQVQASENRPTAAPIFRYDHQQEQLIPATLPDTKLLTRLEEHGFDTTLLHSGGGYS